MSDGNKDLDPGYEPLEEDDDPELAQMRNEIGSLSSDPPDPEK